MLSDCQNLNRLTGNRGRLHSAHWLASSLKLAVRCPESGCWPSFVCLFVYCVIFVYLVHVSLVADASETESF